MTLNQKYRDIMDDAREEGLQEGIQEGMKEGIKEGKEQVALQMILSGMSDEQILTLTNLSSQRIIGLRKN